MYVITRTPWLESSAMIIRESIEVLVDESQFWAGIPKKPSKRLKMPSGEESYSHSHTTLSATPEAMPGR